MLQLQSLDRESCMMTALLVRGYRVWPIGEPTEELLMRRMKSWHGKTFRNFLPSDIMAEKNGETEVIAEVMQAWVKWQEVEVPVSGKLDKR